MQKKPKVGIKITKMQLMNNVKISHKGTAKFKEINRCFKDFKEQIIKTNLYIKI
jgi:hypothetical protein